VPAAVAALQLWGPSSAPAAEAAGGLLRNLTARHPANRARLGAAGVPALVAALQAHAAALLERRPNSGAPLRRSRSGHLPLLR